MARSTKKDNADDTKKPEKQKRVKKTPSKIKTENIRAKVDEIMQRTRRRSHRDASGVAVTENRLELLIAVVNRSKGEFYSDLIQSFDVNMQFIALGRGTADAKMLSRLGFTDSDKTVIFAVIQGNKIPVALEELEKKFNTIKNGKGIAYTVPLSGVIGTLIFGFLSNNRMTVKEGTK